MDGSRPPTLASARPLTASLAVAAVAIGLFALTVGHGFAFDDVSEIVRNEYVRSLGNLGRIFSSGAWEGAGEQNPIYRPLTSATYALNYALGGLSPAGYHAVNVLLHAIVSALVVALGLRLALPLGTAVLASLLFAVHPLHVEVVANVAGRKDELATLFTIAFVLAHGTTARRGFTRAAAASVALAAALLSKETGAACLVLAVAWDLLIGRDALRSEWKRTAALYAVYGAEFALYLLARRASVGSFGVPSSFVPFAENPLAHVETAPRLLTAVAVLGRGLWMQLFPWPLSPDYSFDAIPLVHSVADPRFALSALAIAAVSAATVVAIRRWPAGAFLAAWYAVGVFPASNLLFRVGTIFGERLLYLPSVASCLAVAALAWRAVARAWSARVAAAAALVALCAGTIAYARTWGDEVSLFTAAVQAQPGSAKAHQLLGAAYMELDRAADAVPQLEAAVAISSSDARASRGAPRVQLGVAYERAGRLTDAARVYGDALALDPGDSDALWRLGVVRWREGRHDEAVQTWQRVVAADPSHARALTDLGIAARAAGDARTAEQLWLRAADADKRAAGPWLSLGSLYLERGDIPRARAAWERFLSLADYGAYRQEREVVAERLRALTVPGNR